MWWSYDSSHKIRQDALRRPSEAISNGIVSSHDMSGHSANRGPTEPLYSQSLHTPLEQPNIELVTTIQDVTTTQVKAMEQVVVWQGILKPPFCFF